MSGEHRKYMLSLLRRTKHLGTVNASLVRYIDVESQFLKDVLRRVIAVHLIASSLCDCFFLVNLQSAVLCDGNVV